MWRLQVQGWRGTGRGTGQGAGQGSGQGSGQGAGQRGGRAQPAPRPGQAACEPRGGPGEGRAEAVPPARAGASGPHPGHRSRPPWEEHTPLRPDAPGPAGDGVAPQEPEPSPLGPLQMSSFSFGCTRPFLLASRCRLGARCSRLRFSPSPPPRAAAR